MQLLHRREFLHLAAGAAALPAVSQVAQAQAYPSRPLRLVVTLAPGGAPDIIARLIGQWLSERLGQPVVVDNRPGGNGNLGTETVVRAPPDGYTLLMALSFNAINGALYDNLSFNFIRDTAPIASIASTPFILEVNPAVPAKTPGSPVHVAGELFKMMAGVDIVSVPYRGGEGAALPDLISGQVQVMFGAMASSLGYVRGGKLRALAVTSATRHDALPDIPTLGEFLPGYEARGWYGIVAPRGTPIAIVETLNQEINTALTDPNMRKRLTDLGVSVFAGSPADFAKFIVDETEKWTKVIRAANIKPA
jgi:tripartite-type tricarboxylate transporter receptor subunit TctC